MARREGSAGRWGRGGSERVGAVRGGGGGEGGEDGRARPRKRLVMGRRKGFGEDGKGGRAVVCRVQTRNCEQRPCARPPGERGDQTKKEKGKRGERRQGHGAHSGVGLTRAFWKGGRRKGAERWGRGAAGEMRGLRRADFKTRYETKDGERGWGEEDGTEKK